MLYFLVEGGDDKRFVQEIIVPLLADPLSVDVYEYASRTTKEVTNLIRSLDAMSVSYIFLADLDKHPCITSKKDALRLRYASLREDCIAIVNCEIESWYIGGLSEKTCRSLRAKQSLPCERFTKERFEMLQCKAYPTSLALMKEILADYCLTTARDNSHSLQYLLTRRLALD